MNLRSPAAARYRPLPPLPPCTALYRPRFRSNAVSRKELLASAAHIGPVAHEPRRGGQPFEDHRTVTFRNHPRIQQHDRPDVPAAADQAPESLLELEGGVRDQVVREAVQPPRLQTLQPRGREGLSRNLEGRSEEHTSELQSRRDLVCR